MPSRGAIMPGGERIQVGLPHAGQTADITAGLFAGPRCPELAALRPGDIDLESCTIGVERQLIGQLGGGSAFGPSKSRAGRRVVSSPTSSQMS